MNFFYSYSVVLSTILKLLLMKKILKTRMKMKTVLEEGRRKKMRMKKILWNVSRRTKKCEYLIIISHHQNSLSGGPSG